MFDALGSKLGATFERLRKKGALTEKEVSAAMREIRVALLEADVSLPIVKKFIESVGKRAVGHEVLKSVTPGQMVVKIVHDQLVEMLGPEDEEINLKSNSGSRKTKDTDLLSISSGSHEKNEYESDVGSDKSRKSNNSVQCTMEVKNQDDDADDFLTGNKSKNKFGKKFFKRS